MLKSKLKEAKLQKLLITAAVILLFVVITFIIPLRASALNITISGASIADKPNTMCITTTLTFQAGERIPINNVQAIISGATDITIEFAPSGNLMSVTGDLGASHISPAITRMEEYNYGYGYMVGYDNGYGYGYDFGYGYGYSAADTVVRYVICFNVDYLTPGDHNLQVKVNTGELVKPSFSSDLHAFHIDGISLTLTAGWNEYTWQRPAATLSQIDTIIGLGGIGSNEALSQWDNTTKVFKSYISGLGGNDPTISPGAPVWIAVTSEKSFEI